MNRSHREHSGLVAAVLPITGAVPGPVASIGVAPAAALAAVPAWCLVIALVRSGGLSAVVACNATVVHVYVPVSVRAAVRVIVAGVSPWSRRWVRVCVR